MRLPLHRLVTVLLLFLIAHPATALPQQDGPDTVYRSEYFELHSKVRSLMHRAFNATTDEQRMPIAEQQLLLTRRVHALGEEVDRANLEGLKRGEPPNKPLLLISQGCYMMDATLSAAENYMDAGDSIFVIVAKESDGLADKLSSAIQ
ncbi:hypothetical protein [Paraburkholderia sp. RL17-337-BIB-A]|uniref:hypothetical protein n=1 Tax=Paraburkholderia sp. RL17-337-BIB-A TaxID=3031636 RepID=UPI0038BDE3BB